MKALSIKQPWAWSICAGHKDIENRNWRIGRNPQYGTYQSQQADFGLTVPCRIYVHAGKNPDDSTGFRSFFGIMKKLHFESDANIIYNNYFHLGQILGAIIGEVDIVDCVDKSDSPWFTGKYGFVLTNPALYDIPIPCRGQLGFFTPDIPPEACNEK
jgi:hypothetical protein